MKRALTTLLLGGILAMQPVQAQQSRLQAVTDPVLWVCDDIEEIQPEHVRETYEAALEGALEYYESIGIQTSRVEEPPCTNIDHVSTVEFYEDLTDIDLPETVKMKSGQALSEAETIKKVEEVSEYIEATAEIALANIKDPVRRDYAKHRLEQAKKTLAYTDGFNVTVPYQHIRRRAQSKYTGCRKSRTEEERRAALEHLAEEMYAHEIGHVLGLVHAWKWPNKTEVEAPYIPTGNLMDWSQSCPAGTKWYLSEVQKELVVDASTMGTAYDLAVSLPQQSGRRVAILEYLEEEYEDVSLFEYVAPPLSEINKWYPLIGIQSE